MLWINQNIWSLRLSTSRKLEDQFGNMVVYYITEENKIDDAGVSEVILSVQLNLICLQTFKYLKDFLKYNLMLW